MDMIQHCCTNTAADWFHFLLTGIIFWITSDPQKPLWIIEAGLLLAGCKQYQSTNSNQETSLTDRYHFLLHWVLKQEHHTNWLAETSTRL